MKTSPVTHADLTRSVLAVPPLARHPDLSLNREANKTLINHIESGGVSTLLYGGNANLYNFDVSEYAQLLDFLEENAGADTWVIPSAGPDFGKMMAQARILRGRKFPAPMVLPMRFAYTSEGAADGLRRFSDALGLPIILYVKSEGFLSPGAIAGLVREGRVAAIKYAVVRENPEVDDFLTQLLQRVDRKLVISGIGERPAIVHLRQFGLSGFTSGSVCVGPRGSMALLEAIKAGRYDDAQEIRAAYIPLEDCRDDLSPIRVLHAAVTLAGIADMGPILPMLSPLDEQYHARVQAAARALLEHDRAMLASAA